MKNGREQTTLIDAARPLARKDGLVIEELDDETLIYDTERDRAHCLNSAAARIWRCCDGIHTLADMRDDFAGDMPIDVAQEVVSDCVLRLSRAHLLEEGSLPVKGGEMLSRRKLLRKITIGAAAAAIALPLITSVVAPPPAGAASCGSFSCNILNGFHCPNGCTCHFATLKCRTG